MKYLFFFLFVTTLFSNELFLYQDKTARITTSVAIKHRNITNLPNTIDPKSITIFSPKKSIFTYENASKPTLLQIEQYFIDKKVKLQNNQEVILRDIVDDFALVQNNHDLFYVKKQSLIFPTYPHKLIKPQQISFLEPKKLPKKAIINYTFSGISFEPLYRLYLSKKATFEGLFLITNNTNSAFTTKKLHFVISDMKQQRNPYPIMYKAMAIASDSPQIQPKQHSNFTLYTITTPTTLYAKKSLYIPFYLEVLPFEKKLIAKASSIFYQKRKKIQPTIQIKLKPTKTLPKGEISIFKNKTFLTKTFIHNTPKNKTITLSLGKDMFSYIQQKTTHYQNDKTTYAITIDYTFTNKSDTQKTLTLYIPYTINKNHTLSTSQSYTQIDSHTIAITKTLQPNSSQTVTLFFKGKH